MLVVANAAVNFVSCQIVYDFEDSCSYMWRIPVIHSAYVF